MRGVPLNADYCRSFSIEKYWEELTGIDRHWVMIQGVLTWCGQSMLVSLAMKILQTVVPLTKCCQCNDWHFLKISAHLVQLWVHDQCLVGDMSRLQNPKIQRWRVSKGSAFVIKLTLVMGPRKLTLNGFGVKFDPKVASRGLHITSTLSRPSFLYQI